MMTFAGSKLLDSIYLAQNSSWLAIASPPTNSLLAVDLLEALGASTVGVAICDRDLRFIAVNHALAEINDAPPEEHPGRLIHEFVGELSPTIEARLEEVFKTGQPLRNAELVGKIGMNSRPGHWIENYFPIFSGRKSVIRVGVIVVSVAGLRHSAAENNSSADSFGIIDIRSVQLPAANRQAPVSSNGTGHNSRKRHSRLLTSRETEVLKLIANGASTREAAIRLEIGVKTVETYRSRLMLKLRARSAAQLTHYAIRHHVVDLL